MNNMNSHMELISNLHSELHSPRLNYNGNSGWCHLRTPNWLETALSCFWKAIRNPHPELSLKKHRCFCYILLASSLYVNYSGINAHVQPVAILCQLRFHTNVPFTHLSLRLRTGTVKCTCSHTPRPDMHPRQVQRLSISAVGYLWSSRFFTWYQGQLERSATGRCAGDGGTALQSLSLSPEM